MGTFLDTLAIILWILAALFPIFSLVFMWRKKNIKWFHRVIIGLIVGGAGGFLLFWIGLSIALRNGVGVL